MKACEQLQPLEIILTINGYTQDSIGSADSYNCEIITLEEPIESPNLYVIGAKSKGQYLLFLDENYMVPSLLIQFLQPLLNGCADVVLNNLDDFLSKQQPNLAMIWQRSYKSLFIAQI